MRQPQVFSAVYRHPIQLNIELTKFEDGDCAGALTTTARRIQASVFFTFRGESPTHDRYVRPVDRYRRTHIRPTTLVNALEIVVFVFFFNSPGRLVLLVATKAVSRIEDLLFRCRNRIAGEGRDILVRVTVVSGWIISAAIYPT